MAKPEGARPPEPGRAFSPGRRSTGGVEGVPARGRSRWAPGRGGVGDDCRAALGEKRGSGPTWGLGKWNQGLFRHVGAAISKREATRRAFGVGPVGRTPSNADDRGHGRSGPNGHPPGGKRRSGFRSRVALPQPTLLHAGNGPRRRQWAARPLELLFHVVPNAWDIIARTCPLVAELRRLTGQFVSAFGRATSGLWSRKQPCSTSARLRSQTFFRTADGSPLAWEGCMDDVGSCFGSCTHVWNYDWLPRSCGVGWHGG